MPLPSRPTDPSLYRGEDRRQRRQGAAAAPGGVPLALVGAVVVAALVLASVITSVDAVRGEALHETLRVVRAALLTGAGLLCLVRWRLTGLTRPAFIGVALLVLGLLGESMTTLAPVVLGEQAMPLSNRPGNTAAALAAAALFLWARRAPAVDARARPTHLLVVVGVLVPVLATATVLVTLRYGAAAAGAPAAVSAAATAVLWLLVAGSEHRAGLEKRAPWLVHVLALLGLFFTARAVAVWEAEPAGSIAAVLAFAAGAVALHGASRDLLQTLSAQSQDLLRLTVDVHEHEQRHRSRQEREQEQLHEVRNVLAGLHGAASTLRKYEGRLDPGVRRRLEDAVTGELRRLSHLVDPSLTAPLVHVDLAQALAPVVEAEREQGADLRVDLHGACVRGRAADIATVVSALLVNARRHAPGSPVVLRADQGDGETRLSVEDRGPGVPLEHRQSVFERGERAGATTPGSGLGLYTVQRLVGEMGGTVRANGRPGGGASFVVTLPSATTTATEPDAGPADRRTGDLSVAAAGQQAGQR